tara:strand:+ start:461 stop:1189 length:729 start_codon:yes stop_codon:yes gene_type:complete
MLKAQPLKQAEQERHNQLIKDFFIETRGEEPLSINLHGNGVEKGVYRVVTSTDQLLAAAGSIDLSRRLLSEYNLLSVLHTGTPNFFPRPIAHYAPKDAETRGDLFLMEFLPHVDVDEIELGSFHQPSGYYRALAYEIGRGVAIVNYKTGRFSSEPHDGNILVAVTQEGQSLDIKFCDAIQFKQGNIEDAAQSILEDKETRPECFRFIGKFREGLIQGMSECGVDYDGAVQNTKFLRQYNDIF